MRPREPYAVKRQTFARTGPRLRDRLQRILHGPLSRLILLVILLASFLALVTRGRSDPRTTQVRRPREELRPIKRATTSSSAGSRQNDIARVLSKARAGSPVTISTLGGATTACQVSKHSSSKSTLDPSCFPRQIFEYWNATFPHPYNALVNGAPATSSELAFCLADHLPSESDLIFLEVDEGGQNGHRLNDLSNEITFYEIIFKLISNGMKRSALVLWSQEDYYTTKTMHIKDLAKSFGFTYLTLDSNTSRRSGVRSSEHGRQGEIAKMLISFLQQSNLPDSDDKDDSFELRLHPDNLIGPEVGRSNHSRSLLWHGMKKEHPELRPFCSRVAKGVNPLQPRIKEGWTFARLDKHLAPDSPHTGIEVLKTESAGSLLQVMVHVSAGVLALRGYSVDHPSDLECWMDWDEEDMIPIHIGAASQPSAQASTYFLGFNVTRGHHLVSCTVPENTKESRPFFLEGFVAL